MCYSERSPWRKAARRESALEHCKMIGARDGEDHGRRCGRVVSSICAPDSRGRRKGIIMTEVLGVAQVVRQTPSLRINA